jgi:hypothetical protein
VNAVFPEAVVIAGILPEPMIARVRVHARRLLEKSRSQPDLLSYLRMYRSAMGPCPLLGEDGACGIYDSRPIACRSLLSTRESHCCGLDFGTMSREEKAAFIAGLDVTEVSFPMHYAAVPQDRGQELERTAARSMTSALGFSLYGNLPFLIWLEQEYHLSKVALEGSGAVINLLEREGLANPFLVTLEEGDANGDLT